MENYYSAGPSVLTGPVLHTSGCCKLQLAEHSEKCFTNVFPMVNIGELRCYEQLLINVTCCCTRAVVKELRTLKNTHLVIKTRVPYFIPFNICIVVKYDCSVVQNTETRYFSLLCPILAIKILTKSLKIYPVSYSI